jgi:DnaJ-class molecular chaperone
MSREMQCPYCKGTGLDPVRHPDGVEIAWYPEMNTEGPAYCDNCDGSGEIPDPERDPTPWCHACGSMTAKGCDCPKPFYAENH